MNKKFLSLCLAALLGCVNLPAQSTTPPGATVTSALDDRLAAIKALKIDYATITLIEHDESPTVRFSDGKIQNNVPPRTIVQLVLTPAQGSHIKVEIWLPDAEKWNDRMMGIGNGGAAGRISPGTLIRPLASGYAAVTTDMGTAPDSDSGIGNPEVWKDFGFRATHLMTVVGKQIITAYYGKGPEFSYFNGSSTGGQQALQEAQRYPEDYDGIVAAVPGHCRTPLHAYFLWNYQILQKTPFTQEQEAAVIAAGNEYRAPREAPAVAGKFISDPRTDTKEIEAVIALALKRDPSLTTAHADALRKLFDGPRHTDTGERIFNGLPFGSAFTSGHHLYLFKWVFGGNKNLTDLNFGADIDFYTAALGPYLNAENPDLSAFEKRGGKILMTSGSADSIVPYHATLDYYERVAEHFGSIEKVRSFFRYYLVPGMGHGGGPGIQNTPSLIEIVRNWRETGTVPEMIQGKRLVDGKVELEMPLYPYPTRTSWDAATASFKPVEGSRGGVARVAARFRPAAE